LLLPAFLHMKNGSQASLLRLPLQIPELIAVDLRVG